MKRKEKFHEIRHDFFKRQSFHVSFVHSKLLKRDETLLSVYARKQSRIVNEPAIERKTETEETYNLWDNCFMLGWRLFEPLTLLQLSSTYFSLSLSFAREVRLWGSKSSSFFRVKFFVFDETCKVIKESFEVKWLIWVRNNKVKVRKWAVQDERQRWRGSTDRTSQFAF
jgi:hypothetical protein